MGFDKTPFETCVQSQIDLLNAGKPLEAFDMFFAPSGRMFANDNLFANGATEGRKKQEPYIAAAASITGLITDLKILTSDQICVFRNQSSFSTTDGQNHQIDGLCWQKWCGGQIVEERYYDGNHMKTLIDAGILHRPDLIT